MNLEPPGEHELLVFWVSLLVLVAVARLLGVVAQRVGQPAVVGELTAGVLLGPSVLGRLAPDVTDWLFPEDDAQTAMLFTVGWIGVLFLLVSTGYETDLGLLRRLGRAAATVSTGSLAVPLAAGIALGLVMPSTFMGESQDTLVFALFIGAALSISSLPVIAKILSEMQLMRRNFGQLTLAAGMANDVVGWVLLGVIAGLASAGGLEFSALAVTVLGVAAFFAVAFTVGQRLVDRALRRARAGDGALAGTTTVVVGALVAGSVTQWLGVEAVLGAFVMGILLGRSKFRDDRSIHRLETMTNSLFAPVFFATAGLRVDLGVLGEPDVLGWAVAVLLVASLSKFAGALAGARVASMSGREGAALGVGLNARGALEIVIATVGLSLGVLNQASYTLIVLMAIATSMMAPPLLRVILSSWGGDADEVARLEREAVLAQNVVVRDERILLPTTGGLNSVMAAQVLDLAWPDEAPVTTITVTGNGHDPDLGVIDNIFGEREVHHVTSGGGVADAVLAEARLGCGAIVLGASGTRSDQHLFSPLVDEVVRRSPVPVVVVRRAQRLETALPWAYARALVGVAGTTSSRAAQEVAFNLSARIGTEVVLAHVVSAGNGSERASLSPAPAIVGGSGDRSDQGLVGRRLLNDASGRGDRHRARTTALLERHETRGSALVDLCSTHDADLVVLGASRRQVADEFFLGHTVEEVISDCPVTVAVVVLPESRNGET